MGTAPMPRTQLPWQPCPSCAWLCEDKGIREVNFLRCSEQESQNCRNCSSQPPPRPGQELRVGRRICCNVLQRWKTAPGPEKTVEGKTSTFLQRWQGSVSRTPQLQSHIGCSPLTADRASSANPLLAVTRSPLGSASTARRALKTF